MNSEFEIVESIDTITRGKSRAYDKIRRKYSLHGSQFRQSRKYTVLLNVFMQI